MLKPSPVMKDPDATSISESLSEEPPVSSLQPRHQSSVPAKRSTRSNVAVISIRGKDMKESEGNGCSRQHRKSPLKKKSGASLGVQVNNPREGWWGYSIIDSRGMSRPYKYGFQVNLVWNRGAWSL